MNIQCLRCKGRRQCGRTVCAHVAKLSSNMRFGHDKENFVSQSPAPFVGRFNYPNVNVGILTPPENTENAWEFDAPIHWSKQNMPIERIIDYRSALLNSKFTARSKLIETAQEVALASRPAELEITIEEKPRFRMQTDDVSAPMGPNARLKKAELTSNPKIDTKVERAFSDTDLKAVAAVNSLYKNGYDENFLSKILSVGTLGVQTNRRLVPTRWSITAVDDIVAKKLIDEVKDNASVNEHLAYFAGYLGNHYLIMLVPGVWSYELFETSPEGSFCTDHENYFGRKEYAHNCAGGYYSVRLAVLEALKGMKRQASCLVIRVITGEYYVPLGVWVTRQAARKSLEIPPLKFSSKELMLKYAEVLLKKKFGMDASRILSQSMLLKDLKIQKTLSAYQI